MNLVCVVVIPAANLSLCNQVVFVDSARDELAILAASGQKVEHEVPDWRERLKLQRLEAMVRKPPLE